MSKFSHTQERLSGVILALCLMSTSATARAQDPVYEDDLEAEAAGLEFGEDEALQDTDLDSGEVLADEVETPPEPVESVDSADVGWHAGFVVGGGYNRLNQPTDPEGAPTLLYGSSFSGAALQLGVNTGLVLARPTERAAIWIDLGVLYGWMQGIGYAENASRTKRQTVKLSAHTLRIPLLIKYSHALSSKLDVQLGIGGEFLPGLASKAEVLFEQIAAPPEPLYTKPTTHIGVLMLAGVSVQLKDNLYLPVALRLTYDPQVGSSTLSRFDGYESMENPGQYEVAFNLHTHLTTGLEWRF